MLLPVAKPACERLTHVSTLQNPRWPIDRLCHSRDFLNHINEGNLIKDFHFPLFFKEIRVILFLSYYFYW